MLGMIDEIDTIDFGMNDVHFYEKGFISLI